MNPFQETITSMMYELGRDMNVRDNFINYFISNKILTMEEKGIIMAKAKEGPTAKNSEFLSIIMTKPEKEALRVLLEALRNTAQPHLAKKIEEEYARQTSHSAQLPVLMHPPKFTVKPKDKDVKEGDKAEFHATAKGKPIPEITWFKGDELIKATDRVTMRGDRTSTLTIHKATDSCELRVCATNTAGEDNCTARLSVASRFATHGSYLARDSGTVLHLCQVEDDGSIKAYTDTVRAIFPAAVVWPENWDPPSVPGVEVVQVDRWEGVVSGLQDAESRGHKTVAVAAWGVDIKPLLDHIAARRDPAATDVWLLRSDTDRLSRWQRQLDKDSRYQRIK